MKSGPFIEFMSRTLGVEASTTKLITRNLREAGFMTTGARGVNAPDMTSLDAARLLIAIMTDSPPSRVLHYFNIYRNLQPIDVDAQPKALAYLGADVPDRKALADALGVSFEATAETYVSKLISKLPTSDFPNQFTVENDDGSRDVSNCSITLHDSCWRGMDIQLGDVSVPFFYEEGPTEAEHMRKALEIARARGEEENWLDYAPELSRLQIARTVGNFALRRIANGLSGGE